MSETETTNATTIQADTAATQTQPEAKKVKEKTTAQLVAAAEKAHDDNKASIARGATFARIAGQALIDLKKRVTKEHKADRTFPVWTAWAETNVKIPTSTRSHYMSIAKHWEKISANLETNMEDVSQNQARLLTMKKPATPNAGPKNVSFQANKPRCISSIKTELEKDLEFIDTLKPQDVETQRADLTELRKTAVRLANALRDLLD